ncbi:FecR family protein [Flavivirga eckloniae]|uniref:Anti-sigma factor n=1 Tax=Flavivirga eckloniae TaxID=1803846 RepID=A0A2K9PSB4_9FLAO|nr:FecR domain-containing protein [Flavivirga eckloniae]AUP79962.1 anti-sigma factor [Flavivirga eckloniae]
MTKKDMEKIISKYINNEASVSEIDGLSKWLDKKENLKIFKEYLTIHHTLNSDLIFDSLAAYENFSNKDTSTKKARKLFLTPIFKYAAAILIFVSAGYFFLTKDKPVKDNTPIIVNNKIKIGTDKATLTLSEGSSINLEKGKKYTTDNLNSNGEEIIYNSQPATSPKIAYNYLTIPRGGQFSVKLSDGTQIWLNSESQIKYPVAFIKGQTREVELIYGEAYFDVTSSTKHHGAKFKVAHNMQEVEVLGTEFNIKAYQDEVHVYTTLVEGKVGVSNGAETVVLKPKEQSIVGDSKDIETKNIDIYNEISWREGVFSFEGKSLKSIMKVLSRWYDMDVTFNNAELEDVRFIGVLGKEQKIEEILNTITDLGFINSYEINNKKIVLK